MTVNVQPQRDTDWEEQALEEEAWLNRLLWTTHAAAVALAACATVFFLLVVAEETWQYVAFPAVVITPLLFGIVSGQYVLHKHVQMVRRQQARLLMRSIELEKMASRDELTQLYNRRYFYEQFNQMLTRARASKQSLALILLDIDGLKRINDEYGHAVGDIMIANLGRVIEKHVRSSDVAARLGGDEFAILMPETDKRGAYSLAQRMWEELEEVPMYEHEGITLMLNVSIGVSGYPWGGEDIDEMIHWADSDMYANKVSRKLPQAPVSPEDEKVPDDWRPGDYEWV